MREEIDVTLKPVQTKKASEKIYEQIRQLIVDGEICPGQRLPSERKMMEQMHRSRATVREALRLLERDGYIRTQPGSSGAIVQKPNVDNAVQSLESVMQVQMLNLDNILEFRRMTEGVGASFAARRRTEGDLEKISAVIEQTRACAGDRDRFIEADLRFHIAVAEAAKNEMYVIMLLVCRQMIGEALGDLLEKGTEEEKAQRYSRILQSHEKIYDAIAAGREKEAEEEMMKHIMDAESDLH